MLSVMLQKLGKSEDTKEQPQLAGEGVAQSRLSFKRLLNAESRVSTALMLQLINS